MKAISYATELSGDDTNSFAYKTIRDRLPVILTKVIDYVHRNRHNLSFCDRKVAYDHAKIVISGLSELRYRLTTDKPLLPIGDDVYNNALIEYKSLHKCDASWFTASWLLIECYFYATINDCFNKSEFLHGYDPYKWQKQQAFTNGESTMHTLAEFLFSSTEADGTLDHSIKSHLEDWLQLSLWGNRSDLSISSGEIQESAQHLHQLEELSNSILSNDLSKFSSQMLVDNSNSPKLIHIILDNAGPELFADLCLAEFLLSQSIAKSVHFHVKNQPWFVSDVTEQDLHWTLEALASSKQLACRKLASILQKRFGDSLMTHSAHPFWTSPFPFAQLRHRAPDLYLQLQQADFLIFKGDLNYRKLTGDRAWSYCTAFKDTLGGFCPSTLLALRVLKADTVVGLKEGVAEAANKKSADWMTNGEFAVIQMVEKGAFG